MKIEIFCEATKNEAKQQMSGFLAMLLNTLRERLLENILAGKNMIRGSKGTIKAFKNVWFHPIVLPYMICKDIMISRYRDIKI